MKKLFFSLIALSLFAGSTAYAQDYSTAVGVNLGPDMGFTAKKFITPESAIEAQFAYNISCDGLMASAVYQYHFPLGEGFSLYAGGGLNIGVLHMGKKYGKSDFALGVDPNVGFEYSFRNAPIVLGIDYKPNINFTTHSQWELASFKIRFKL